MNPEKRKVSLSVPFNANERNGGRMELVERANNGLHEHVVKCVQARVPDFAARILDLGCGTGALLFRLRNAGYTDLQGIDIQLPVDQPAGINFAEFDFDSGQLPYPDTSFDVIISVEVFEHLENMGSALHEMTRILKPSGRIVLTTPNVHSLEARLRFLLTGNLKQFDAIADPTHIYPVFLHPFTKILERNSLTIANKWSFPEDGSSPTSRAPLRFLASLTRFLRLPDLQPGDHLCLELTLSPDANGAKTSKRAMVTAHY